MENKPYVTHKGIKRTPLTVEFGCFGTCTIADWRPTKMQGRRVISTDKIIDGKTLYVDLDKHPEIETLLAQANEQYEQEFMARYPGIYELVAAIDDEDNYHEAFERMMEDEHNDGAKPPKQPALSTERAAEMYPIASAYLTICNYTDADPSSQVGYDKRSAGTWAIEQLEAGRDVIQVRDEMMARYQAAREADTTSIWA